MKPNQINNFLPEKKYITSHDNLKENVVYNNLIDEISKKEICLDEEKTEDIVVKALNNTMPIKLERSVQSEAITKSLNENLHKLLRVKDEV